MVVLEAIPSEVEHKVRSHNDFINIGEQSRPCLFVKDLPGAKWQRFGDEHPGDIAIDNLGLNPFLGNRALGPSRVVMSRPLVFLGGQQFRIDESLKELHVEVKVPYSVLTELEKDVATDSYERFESRRLVVVGEITGHQLIVGEWDPAEGYDRSKIPDQRVGVRIGNCAGRNTSRGSRCAWSCDDAVRLSVSSNNTGLMEVVLTLARRRGSLGPSIPSRQLAPGIPRRGHPNPPNLPYRQVGRWLSQWPNNQPSSLWVISALTRLSRSADRLVVRTHISSGVKALEWYIMSSSNAFLRSIRLQA